MLKEIIFGIIFAIPVMLIISKIFLKYAIKYEFYKSKLDSIYYTEPKFLKLKNSDIFSIVYFLMMSVGAYCMIIFPDPTDKIHIPIFIPFVLYIVGLLLYFLLNDDSLED